MLFDQIRWRPLLLYVACTVFVGNFVTFKPAALQGIITVLAKFGNSRLELTVAVIFVLLVSALDHRIADSVVSSKYLEGPGIAVVLPYWLLPLALLWISNLLHASLRLGYAPINPTHWSQLTIENIRPVVACLLFALAVNTLATTVFRWASPRVARIDFTMIRAQRAQLAKVRETVRNNPVGSDEEWDRLLSRTQSIVRTVIIELRKMSSLEDLVCQQRRIDELIEHAVCLNQALERISARRGFSDFLALMQSYWGGAAQKPQLEALDALIGAAPSSLRGDRQDYA